MDLQSLTKTFMCSITATERKILIKNGVCRTSFLLLLDIIPLAASTEYLSQFFFLSHSFRDNPKRKNTTCINYTQQICTHAAILIK